MSLQIMIDIPETSFSILRTTSDMFAYELRLAAAVKWYEIGRISQSKAAELAGISRTEFLTALSQFNVSPFQTSPEELVQEVKNV